MDESPHRYPLARARRRPRRLVKPPISWPASGPSWPRVLAALVIAAALLASGWELRRLARPGPREEIAAGVALLRAGNYSAARTHAQAATRLNPDWGAAHAVLARAYLLLGEGVPAEGALIRARVAGFDPARGHLLLAEAALLQNDPDRALAEVTRAGPGFRAQAGRVTARALAQKGDIAAARATLERVLAQAPRDAAGWADLGRVRLDTGDMLGASDAAARAVSLDGANLAALVLAGEVARARRGLIASLPWYAAALKHDAYYVPALVDQAAALGDAGRYREMLVATRAALAARPGEPRAMYLQAVLAARAGKRDLARAMLAKTGGVIAHVPGVLLLSGVLEEAAGHHERAIEAWREVVGQQPMNIVVRRLLGAALLRSGDARGALDVLRPVALRADADAYTLTLVGRAFEATGERGWAARFLDRAAGGGGAASAPFGGEASVATLASAVDDHPDDPARLVDLARAQIAAGQGDAALARAKALTVASPGAAAGWLLLGDTFAALDRPRDAVAAYGRAADLRFDEPVMLRLVEALARVGERAQAARALALFRFENPDNVAAERLTADLRFAASDGRGAIGPLEALRARTGSRDVALLGALSAAYLSAGDAAAGRDYARAAYRLQPMNAATADAYGWALYALGDDAGAVQLLGKAAALAPRSGEIRMRLAQANADAARR